jgi:hypothetical protein
MIPWYPLVPTLLLGVVLGMEFERIRRFHWDPDWRQLLRLLSLVALIGALVAFVLAAVVVIRDPEAEASGSWYVFAFSIALSMASFASSQLGLNSEQLRPRKEGSKRYLALGALVCFIVGIVALMLTFFLDGDASDYAWMAVTMATVLSIALYLQSRDGSGT